MGARRALDASRLDVRLLGGFEVARGTTALAGFESQKARALFAYLGCHAGRAVSREHLSGLLWPEAEPESARRNLRQALYSLRHTLGERPVAAGHQDVAVPAHDGIWIDVVAFREAAAEGLAQGGWTHLARAADLYRGDLLAGFFVKESGPFEEWLLTEQERLRETAIAVLRELADRLLARGELEVATAHARRLVEMDPLSEEAHRLLMRLHALGGRRSHALAQYQTLVDLLDRELSVEPVDETRALHEAIVGEELAGHLPRKSAGPVGPVVPLAGRARELAQLSGILGAVAAGGARLTVIVGEEGVGKTRLVRAFLHQAGGKRRLAVLQGRCETPPAVPVALAPLGELVAAVLPGGIGGIGPDRAAAQTLAVELAGRLGLAVPATDGPRPPETPVATSDLAIALLRSLAEPEPATGGSRPLAIFLDELQRATAATCELVGRALAELSDRPVWIVAAVDAAGLPGTPLASLLAAPELAGRLDRIELGRLSEGAVTEIATALVGTGARGAALARFLGRHGGGLPLALAELVNLLCDERLLTPAGAQRWDLAGDAELEALAPPEGLCALFRRRVRNLPSSARRLLGMAAAIGQKFDVELLQRAAGEHPGVLEIAVELAIEGWLLRQFARIWSTDPRERDLVLWARGVRRGTFEFAHPRLRRAILDDISVERRGHLHLAVAQALAAAPEAAGHHADHQAFHLAAGGEAGRARPMLEEAARRALALGDAGAAGAFRDLASQPTDRRQGEG